jgi:hypothetical protein
MPVFATNWLLRVDGVDERNEKQDKVTAIVKNAEEVMISNMKFLT